MVGSAGIEIVSSREIYPALHQPGDAGHSMLVVKSALGRAIIGLQGAQVMSFQPSGSRGWLSINHLFAALSSCKKTRSVTIP